MNLAMAHPKGAKQAAQVRKAVRLLSDAVALLEACGVTIAVDHCRLALTAAVAAAEEYSAQVAAARMRQRVAASMPSDKESLIRKDGTLRYVSHMKRAGKRPEVVAVSFRVPGLPSLVTTFTLVGREFDDVYDGAVRAFGRHLGVTDDVTLIDAMLSTRSAFKVRYGL